MTDRTPDLDPPAPRVAETRARQGFRDRPVLVVLAVSLLLAVIALFGLYFARAGQLESTNADAGRDRRDAESFNTTPQPAKSD
jgi:hypothetical protein